MKITKVTAVGRKPVYDISVKDAEHYVLLNGVVTHNSGPMYSANNVLFIGKSQEKHGNEIVGYNFTINVEKSRFAKEKSKLNLLVTYEKGISKWSGLLDIAIESNNVVSPSKGWFSRVNTETGEIEDKKWRASSTECKEFWAPILSNKSFQEWVRNRYQVSSGKLISDESIDQELNIADEDIDREIQGYQ